MTFNKTLFAFALCLFSFQAFSSALLVKEPGTPLTLTADQKQQMEDMLSTLSSKDISALSIKEVEAFTHHEMSFKEKVAFKLAKLKVKKMERKMDSEMRAADGNAGSPGIDKGVYIILAILIPFLAVGLASNFDGSDWLVCLLLTALCYLPGLIYALVKMKRYYGA